MKTGGLFQIAVVTSAEAEEPVSALLERVFAVPPCIYSDAEKGTSTVTAYVRGPTVGLRARKGEIVEGLRDLSRLGLEIGSGEIRVQAVRREDWSESWKKYFKPIQIGSSLLIKPSWSKQKARKNQAIVVLDPGLSFGTGQHATTSYCLKEIVRLWKSARGQELSLLDIGPGSGILSISAAKLGYSPVHAFDFDPVAVRVAKKNCRANRVAQRVSVSRKDLTKVPVESRSRFDVICANLISNLLIEQKEKIVNRLEPGGSLILAGILAREFETVRRAYQAIGWRLVKAKVEREWQSGTFTAG